MWFEFTTQIEYSAMPYKHVFKSTRTNFMLFKFTTLSISISCDASMGFTIYIRNQMVKSENAYDYRVYGYRTKNW